MNKPGYFLYRKRENMDNTNTKKHKQNPDRKRSSGLKAVLTMSIMGVLFMPQVVFAGKLADNFNKSAGSILGEGQGMLKGILLIVCLVIGAMFFYGGDRMKDSIKARVTMSIFGAFFVMAAAAITTTMLGWF